MLRKILIAVDGSLHSKSALAYVASVFSASTDVQFTIINIQPIISQYLIDEARLDSRADTELRQVMERQRADSEKILETARDQFVRLGIDTNMIHTISQVRHQGQAKDIIDYAHMHLYDAIVVGRRGLSRIQKVFMGSTSAKIMEHAAAIPVWVIDGDVKAQKLLVPVDISEISLQMMEYLSLLLGEKTHLHVTLYHIDETPGRSSASLIDSTQGAIADIIAKSEQHWADRFWKKAKERFEAAGISNDQVEYLTVPRSGHIAKMIMERIQTGDYDTIFMGRRGSGSAFFFGNVSHYVIERLTDRALWVMG